MEGFAGGVGWTWRTAVVVVGRGVCVRGWTRMAVGAVVGGGKMVVAVCVCVCGCLCVGGGLGRL